MTPSIPPDVSPDQTNDNGGENTGTQKYQYGRHPDELWGEGMNRRGPDTGDSKKDNQQQEPGKGQADCR